MPFQSNEILERIETGIRENRLAHAYLVTGSSRAKVETFARELADLIFGHSHVDHPDFYLVQPESKSRRIRIEQIRILEQSLYLKSMQSPYKIALILDADRMCLGQAEAANAFLKTLEEPPVKTILILTSTQPQALLATILSRCIRLDLMSDEEESTSVSALGEEFLESWKKVAGTPSLRAYRRAQLLNDVFATIREQVQDSFEEAMKDAEDEESENTVKALIEAEFLNQRGEFMILLQRSYWRAALDASGVPQDIQATKGLMILSELQNTLQTNVESGLAIERAMLGLEGAISIGWR